MVAYTLAISGPLHNFIIYVVQCLLEEAKRRVGRYLFESTPMDFNLIMNSVSN